MTKTDRKVLNIRKFENSDLFRISNFVLRIFNLDISTRAETIGISNLSSEIYGTVYYRPLILGKFNPDMSPFPIE